MARYGQSVSGCQNPGHSRHVHQWDGDQYTHKTDTWSGHVNKLGHETLPPASGQAGMNATEDKTLQMIDLVSQVGQTAIVFSKIGYLQQAPVNISCWDPRATLAADCSQIIDSFMVGKILWLGTPVPATLDSWAVEQGNVAI